MRIEKSVLSIDSTLPIIGMPEYFKALGACDYGYIIDDQGHILPYYIRKRMFFTYMVFTTGVLGNMLSEDDEKKFLDAMIQFIKSEKLADFILMNHVTALFKETPTGSKMCRFGSYMLDLSLSEDELFANLHSKHRNVIKKAIRDNIIVNKDSRYKAVCVQLIRETMQRQGITPPPLEYYDRIGDLLGGRCDYWVALDTECNPQGSAIVIWSIGHSAYYLFGGSCENPYTGAMNLLQWSVIIEMKKRGVKTYDFVGARISPSPGSKYEGIQRFKSRFGGQLLQGYLWKMPINSIKYNMYRFMVHAKNLLHGSGVVRDIIDQECFKG